MSPAASLPAGPAGTALVPPTLALDRGAASRELAYLEAPGAGEAASGGDKPSQCPRSVLDFDFAAGVAPPEPSPGG
eukprot:CAMPEP_0183807964 /NCGR_PEP_ID=MMETSP0803_2-20130417/42565_1 /TAXON_ID=195967 /ORGANISM="Crustomastix stigmata, Strain CCMP3273" /LENGTH=75 /DNA_ID=CAMNT_0026052751 /DNA_START=120 /DNA_END=343 /DNA_ORIENTATION=-